MMSKTVYLASKYDMKLKTYRPAFTTLNLSSLLEKVKERGGHLASIVKYPDDRTYIYDCIERY